MWLMDTTSYQLHQVVDASEHKFAILSHTWDNEGEVTFQDIQDLEVARRKTGFRKIERACHVARTGFQQYIWIDTCCIDKSSSAELSEAINSMFHWYRCAELCYVFLSDFEPLPSLLNGYVQKTFLLFKRRESIEERLSRCRWFTRGWTLQELIAPSKVEFFDKNWSYIGGKSDLEETLSGITKIDRAILNHSARLSSIPVARRMSWAAGRKTKRVEDMAYCLLGIFDINMPLLYGEGLKAFYRLQQEIASESNDLSLFAWQKEETQSEGMMPQYGGIFADSPEDFKICATLKRHDDLFSVDSHFTITNTGLRMDAKLCPSSLLPGHRGAYLLGLNCVETSERTNMETLWIAIYLIKVGNTYVRARPDAIATAVARNDLIKDRLSQTIFIQTRLLFDDVQRIRACFQTGIVILYDKGLAPAIVSKSGKPKHSASHQDGLFIFDINGSDNFLGLHTVSLKLGPSPGDTHDIVILCALKWTGASCELIVGLYSETFSRENLSNSFESIQDVSTKSYAKIITELSSPRSKRVEAECLDEVKDMMMTRHSDLSGSLIQEKMPTKVKVFETIFSNSKSSLHQRLLSIKRIERSEVASLLASTSRGASYAQSEMRDGYFYAFLECDPAPRPSAKRGLK